MSLSYKEKLEFIVFGYIRLNYADEIPDDITRICLDYYNKIEITWDTFCDGLTDSVSDDGLEVEINGRAPYSTFASSVGWNKGIHSFTLKQLDSMTYQFGIGVISSHDIPNIQSKDGNYFMFSSNKSTIGYCLDGFSIYSINAGDYRHIADNELNLISAGDKITIIVDCDEWKIYFYINDMRIHSEMIDMVKSQTYHPVFTTWQSTTISLQLVETTVDLEIIKENDSNIYV